MPMRLCVWSEESCRLAHEATLLVLQQSGVDVHHAAARELLAAAGAAVEGARVRIGADMVEAALASAPRSWGLPARADGRVITLADGCTYFGTGPDCLYVRDEVSGERRRGTLADVERMALLAGALPNIDFVMSMVLPHDVEQEVVDLCQFRALLRGTTKPILVSSPFDGRHVRAMHEMAAVAGRAESFACLTTVSPPLAFSFEAADQIVACADLCVPLVHAGAPNCGVTAPMSVSSAAVVANAEVLSGLVLHQAARPGAPFVYAPGVSAMNMSSLVDVFCAPEGYLGNQAAIDLCRHYGLPSAQAACVSDAKLVDEQAAAEFAATAVMGALSGATLLADVAYVESGQQTSCDAMVLADELVGYARSLLRDVPAEEGAFALEEIAAVGPGGTHLGRRHTRDHLRESWRPALIDQASFRTWRDDGAFTLAERVRAETSARLERLPDPVASNDVLRLLDEIVQREASAASSAGSPARE